MPRGISLFIAVLLAAASLNQALAQPAASAAAKMKIGLILPLTGPLAEYGVAFKNGYDMARDDIAEPSPFEFLIEDSQYDPKTALSAFTKLVESDHVDLIYSWGCAPSEAIAPIAESKHVPLFIQCPSKELTRGRKYTVRFVNDMSDFASATWKRIRSRGYTKIGVVKTGIRYLESAVQALKEQQQPGETVTIIDSFPPEAADFKSTIAKLRAQNFHAIGVYLLSGQISQFYRQLEQQQLNIPTFGSDFFDSRSEIEKAGPAIEGAFFANMAVNPVFTKLYRERFGNDLQIAFAGNAYDFVLFALELFGRTDLPRTGEAVMERVRKAPPWRGATGNFELRSDDAAGMRFEFPVVIKSVKKGAIEEE